MDDVSKFLQDVKEMNARRTEEDDARQRELDEKIQQEKRERQARRAGTSIYLPTLHLAVFLLASPLALLLLVSPPLTHCIIYLPTTVSALFNKLSFPDPAKAQILLCSLPCAIRLLVLVPCYVQVQVALGPRAELLTGRPPHWASRGRRLNALTPTPNNHHTRPSSIVFSPVT